eukprot:10559681-Heterocapsa_arctica.AAC.1
MVDEAVHPSGRSRSTSLDSASDGVSPTAPFSGPAEADSPGPPPQAGSPGAPLAALFPVGLPLIAATSVTRRATG